MDPLASVFGVVKLAAHIAGALDYLRTLCKQLPGRIHALSNEVFDIEVVLLQVAKVLEERSYSPISTAETDNKLILQLLMKAETKLKELKLIVDGLAASSKQNNVMIFRAGLWRKEQPRLLALQEDIKAIKSSLNVVLGASNSPISVNDDCPSDKACDIILRGGVSEKTQEILRYLAAGSDFVDSQNVAPIHKIVLKLSLHDLEEEILRNPDDVDIPDANGSTALEWAAARGDDRAVTMLLSYGAEPNVMNKKLNTPLTLASNQNQTVCVRLLLEAGAIPDPILPAGIKFGSPLNCAARNAPDPLLLKTLLDFNANIETSVLMV
ncbi:hypothetical protein VE02_09992 [Pseudogymnoascus sp. 03VT05]|nr:hypothetical protein VE02_09992 [Pseudogymnoascus sp. 03VT05]